MAGLTKRRDLRVKVTMPALLRVQDGRRIEARVHDVSANGLLISCDKQQPPSRGSFVEIFCRGRSIAAQVRWNKKDRSGLALGRSIDIVAAARGEGLVASEDVALEQQRRRDLRQRAMLDIAQSAENSRRLSRAMQFGFIMAVTIGSAALVAQGVSSALSVGLDPVGRVLSVQPQTAPSQDGGDWLHPGGKAGFATAALATSPS